MVRVRVVLICDVKYFHFKVVRDCRLARPNLQEILFMNLATPMICKIPKENTCWKKARVRLVRSRQINWGSVNSRSLHAIMSWRVLSWCVYIYVCVSLSCFLLLLGKHTKYTHRQRNFPPKKTGLGRTCFSSEFAYCGKSVQKSLSCCDEMMMMMVVVVAKISMTLLQK